MSEPLINWTTTRRAWTIAGAVLLASLGYTVYLLMSAVAPGAGAAYQDAPDQVRAGHAVGISLRLEVWGAGGAAAGRYRNVELLIKPDGAPQWAVLHPVRVSDDAKGLTAQFEFIAPQEETSIHYRFKFIFDNQPNELEGIKVISIKPT